MKNHKSILLTLTLILLTSISLAKQPLYSAANNITFKNSGETKSFVGNGFLINYKQKIYAVTAKHVLFETQKSGIENIAIEEYIGQWLLKPFNTDGGDVVLGKLLNTNASEKLDMAVLNDDWLLFEVEKNNSSLVPLKLATETPKQNQQLSAFGCSYKNQDNCTQNKYTGTYVKSLENSLLMTLEDVNGLKGLSGAPVLNNNNEVVAIVSNVIPDKETGTVYFAPFSIKPVLKFLKNLNELNNKSSTKR